MGVDGREVEVIQGKDAKGTTDLSHTAEKQNKAGKSPLPPPPLKGNSCFIQPGTFLSQFLDIIPVITL